MTSRRRALRVLPVLATTAVAAPAGEWKNPFAINWRDAFLKHWKVTRDYTLAYADAMAAEDYGFKPTPAQRTFAEQLVHIGAANAAYMSAFGVKPPPERMTATDKTAVRSYLVATFDYVSDVSMSIQENDLVRSDLKFSARVKPHSGTDLFMRAYMHTAHHRGQLVNYLRAKNITPPTWAFEPSA